MKIREKKKEFWTKFVEELKEEDGNKVWKTIKSLSTGDKGEAPNEVLIAEGREARTDKEKRKALQEFTRE